MSQYAAKLADQLGIYEKNGLNVEVSVFEGDARVAAALQAGQVQVGLSGTSSAISSQLTDVPYNIVGVLAVILTDNLTCQAGIDTAEEVKGKTIAISTFGGTSNAAALLALKSLGLSAADAAITQVGGQAARLAALQGGSVDCAIIDSNVEDDMIAQGFGIAARLKEAGIPFGRSGVSITRDYIAANPNTSLVVIASILEAQNVIFSDPASVVPHYMEHTGRVGCAIDGADRCAGFCRSVRGGPVGRDRRAPGARADHGRRRSQRHGNEPVRRQAGGPARDLREERAQRRSQRVRG